MGRTWQLRQMGGYSRAWECLLGAVSYLRRMDESTSMGDV